ncbi:MAG: hypothetical protein D6B27_06480 [Gammaproteobacteria bacterium]|nr:MAG: hypothetical protein D6B27_06480 [Gammaproteobacteria bacterium]
MSSRCHRVCQRRGVLIVAAAGNDGVDIDASGFWFTSNEAYPANYENENILAVAASGHKDELTDFSNYGVTSVDVAAPGEYILSTIPDN